jgi:hypothetical protein
MNQDFDPSEIRRLQPRARDVFARASRMQDLHAQALAHAATATPRQAEGENTAVAALSPQQLLTLAASQAVVRTHTQLQQAAALAYQLAASDPVLAHLNRRINGAALARPAPQNEVLDMHLAEVSEAAALIPHPHGAPDRLPIPDNERSQ